MTDLATLLQDSPWRVVRTSFETWLVTASGVPLAKLEQPEVAGTLLAGANMAGAVECLVRAARAVGRVPQRWPNDEQWRVPVAELVAAAQAVGGTEVGTDKGATGRQGDADSSAPAGEHAVVTPTVLRRVCPVRTSGHEFGPTSVAPASYESLPAAGSPPASIPQPVPDVHAGDGAPAVRMHYVCIGSGSVTALERVLNTARLVSYHFARCASAKSFGYNPCDCGVLQEHLTKLRAMPAGPDDGGGAPVLTIQACSRCGIEVPWDETTPVVCCACECPDHPTSPAPSPDPIAFDARVRLNFVTSESRIQRYAALGKLVFDDIVFDDSAVRRARIRVTVKKDYLIGGIGRQPWVRKVYPRHFVDECGRVRP